MECLKKTPSNFQSVASMPAPATSASSAAASRNPGDQTADVTDLLGMEPPSRAMPKYKGPLASIGSVGGARAKAPPLTPEVDLTSFAEAPVQLPIPTHCRVNPPPGRAVDFHSCHGRKCR